jgi:hypothetical protein
MHTERNLGETARRKVSFGGLACSENSRLLGHSL